MNNSDGILQKKSYAHVHRKNGKLLLRRRSFSTALGILIVNRVDSKCSENDHIYLPIFVLEHNLTTAVWYFEVRKPHSSRNL